MSPLKRKIGIVRIRKRHLASILLFPKDVQIHRVQDGDVYNDDQLLLSVESDSFEDIYEGAAIPDYCAEYTTDPSSGDTVFVGFKCLSPRGKSFNDRQLG